MITHCLNAWEKQLADFNSNILVKGEFGVGIRGAPFDIQEAWQVGSG